MEEDSLDPDYDYDPLIKYHSMSHRPREKRFCTNKPWLVIFIGFISLWISVTIYAHIYGDPRRVLFPSDAQGRRCGLTSGVEDRPYLTSLDITYCLGAQGVYSKCGSTQVCVKQCPDETILGDTLDPTQFERIKHKLVCKPEVDTNSLTINVVQKYFDEGLCARNVFQSEQIYFYCVPKNTTKITKTLVVLTLRGNIFKTVDGDMNIFPKLQRIVAATIKDFLTIKWFILLYVLTVVAFCFIYIILMRWVAAPLVKSTLLATVCLLSAGLYKSGVNYGEDHVHLIDIFPGPTMLDDIMSKADLQYVCLNLIIYCGVLLGFTVLFLLFRKDRITLAIALIKEGSRYGIYEAYPETKCTELL